MAQSPFDNHAVFHWFLSHDALRAFPERYPRVQEALWRNSNKTVFSHGDLGPHTILWKDGCIVIYWLGWFAEYCHWDFIARCTQRYEKGLVDIFMFKRDCRWPVWWRGGACHSKLVKYFETKSEEPEIEILLCLVRCLSHWALNHWRWWNSIRDVVHCSTSPTSSVSTLS